MEAIRDAFGKAMVEVGHRFPDVVAVSCDLKVPTKLKLFFDAFPDRSFEVGIAEANGVGISAGLAMSGFRPFISSFGAFISGKNVEVRTSIAFNNAPVVIVGTHGGLIGPDGPTQAGLQDIAVMRSIPRFKIFQPATPIETRAIVHHVAESRDIVYLRIARNVLPEIFGSDYEFEPGRGRIVRPGQDLTIISSGPPVHSALGCAECLADRVDIRVVNMPSIKPIDRELVMQCARETRAIVTVEDHTVEGGLGSVIAEVLSSSGLGNPMHIHGIKDEFTESAKPDELERAYKLNTDGVVEVISRAWNCLKSNGYSSALTNLERFSANL